jgi:hypothetical protein
VTPPDEQRDERERRRTREQPPYDLGEDAGPDDDLGAFTAAIGGVNAATFWLTLSMGQVRDADELAAILESADDVVKAAMNVRTTVRRIVEAARTRR